MSLEQERELSRRRAQQGRSEGNYARTMTNPPDEQQPDEQQSASPVARRGFNLGLPEGFIELPTDGDDLESPELTEQLNAQVAAQFGLPPDGDNAAAAAAAFADLGILSGGGGVDYSAIAFYQSPDDPARPIMILVTGIAMPSDHYGKDAAIAGLLETRKADGRGERKSHDHDGLFHRISFSKDWTWSETGHSGG